MVSVMSKALFITVEGVEGVGKSTGLAFIDQYLRERGIHPVMTREPGGSPIAESIRELILGEHKDEMCPETELLLVFAGRAQHIKQVIRPALKAGQWLLCDRFTDATYAYQGGGRTLDEAHIAYLEAWVQMGLQPDVTFLFDAPLEVCLERIRSRGVKDRIEREAVSFFERIRAAYLDRAQLFPERFRVIDASGGIESVQAQLVEYLERLIEP